MSDLAKRLRIKAGMIEMGEMIAWGSDSALMREAADALEMAAPAVQGEAVAITDADILAIAGRVESCPVSPWWLKDDVAIGDVRAAVLRFARALLVAAPPPAEQPECGCCGQTVKCDDDCDAVVLRKADQNPAPDVACLVDALVACARASSAAEVGLIVDAAMDAHRKGGEA